MFRKRVGVELMIIDSLVVAEKDSVARAIAKYLAQGSISIKKVYGVKSYWFTRGGKQWVSIGLRGHIMDVDFPEELNKWHSVEPSKLFDVEPILVIRGGHHKLRKGVITLGGER